MLRRSRPARARDVRHTCPFSSLRHSGLVMLLLTLAGLAAPVALASASGAGWQTRVPLPAWGIVDPPDDSGAAALRVPAEPGARNDFGLSQVATATATAESAATASAEPPSRPAATTQAPAPTAMSTSAPVPGAPVQTVAPGAPADFTATAPPTEIGPAAQVTPSSTSTGAEPETGQRAGGEAGRLASPADSTSGEQEPPASTASETDAELTTSTSLVQRVVHKKAGLWARPQFYVLMVIAYVALLGSLLRLLWRMR